MKLRLSKFELDLLGSAPVTAGLTQSMLDGQMLVGSAEQFDALRDACSDLLLQIGFAENYVANRQGQALEDLIDKLFV